MVFRTSMLTRVAEGQEVAGARREEGETLARRAAAEETVEQARRRSRSKSVERTQVYITNFLLSSVADPGCLSRILISTHPGSKNSNKREG